MNAIAIALGVIVIALMCYMIWRQHVVDQHVQDVEKIARSAHAEAQAGRVLVQAEPPTSVPPPRRKRRQQDRTTATGRPLRSVSTS